MEMYNYKTRKSITDKVKKYYGAEFIRGQSAAALLGKPYATFSMKKIDCKFKAYYLGLLLTDGYVSKNQLGLDLTDEDAIKFISEYIQKPYKKYDPKNYNQNSTSSLNINKENRKPIYRIIINNPILIEEVKRYHIIKDKTYNLSGFAIMENERKYIPYLVRGLIDGDGWVRKDGKEFYICSVSPKFIEWVKYCLENYLYMQDINISNRQVEGCKNIFCARTALYKNIAILKDIIYDEPYGMQRKYLNVHTNNT